MFDLASSAIEALAPHLPAIGRNDLRTAQEMAAKGLYDLIAAAFRRIGEQYTFNAWVNDPRDHTVVSKLLAATMKADPGLTRDINEAVHHVNSNHVDQRGARAGGDLAGRDINKNRTTHHSGGLLAILAVVAVAALLGWGAVAIVNKLTGDTLTADSTCSQFLQAPQDQELSAIRQIGQTEGVAGIGSPLALPAISYSCSGEPTAKLGAVIATFKGQF